MTPAQVAHIMPPLPKPLTLSRGDEDGAIHLGYTADQMQAFARAAVEAALRDAPQQAEGWVMVPVEPTPAMLVAMWDHREAMRGQSENRIARAGYAAMIASRPSAPTAVEPDEPKAGDVIFGVNERGDGQWIAWTAVISDNSQKGLAVTTLSVHSTEQQAHEAANAARASKGTLL